MKRGLLLLMLGVLLSLACLCLPFELVEPGGDPSPRPKPTLTALPQVSTAARLAPEDLTGCLEHLTPLLQQAETGEVAGVELEEEYLLVTYTVSGDQLLSPDYGRIPGSHNLPTYQDDAPFQQKIWQFVAAVTPDDLQAQISQFEFYTDGVSGSLGAVYQTDNPHFWVLELDQLDAANYPELATTLVHELAHLISLNDEQVVTELEVFYHPDDLEAYAKAEAACQTYFLFEGCSRPDSYLQDFFSQYWQKNYPAWLEIDSISDDDQREWAIGGFYHERLDEFVSEYAATSPEEDLAESFMYFVFSPAPTGDLISEQKVLFFYLYPELVAYREQMLTPLCAGLGLN